MSKSRDGQRALAMDQCIPHHSLQGDVLEKSLTQLPVSPKSNYNPFVPTSQQHTTTGSQGVQKK